MSDEALLGSFEEHRHRLRGIAYRMLGSEAEAEDALQETWLRISRADTDDVENVGGWLTTVTGHVCLNMLRARTSRPVVAIDAHVADPIVSSYEGMDPEREAVLADSVGLAMLVVFDALNPAERLAFVLHDVFGVPFDDIAEIVERTPEATRQLASRARRRVQGSAALPDSDLAQQRQVVDAFFAAARAGDFEGLVALLDPKAVLRYDGGGSRRADSGVRRGAVSIAHGAVTFARPDAIVTPAVVNGVAGAVVAADEHVVSVMSFTISGGRVAAIEVLSDPQRLAALDLSELDD